jgi:hypothetical protein
VKTARLEAFSDGVFAIAITLLIIEIKVPEDTSHLLSSLGHLWPSYLGFVISFLVIGLIWANHHAMFDHIQTADRMLLFLNTLLLMLVVFIPFSAGVLAAAFRDGESERTAVVLYGVVLVAGGFPFNAIWEYARRNHRLLGPSITPVEGDRPSLLPRPDPVRRGHAARRRRTGPRPRRLRRPDPVLLAAAGDDLDPQTEFCS